MIFLAHSVRDTWVDPIMLTVLSEESFDDEEKSLAPRSSHRRRYYLLNWSAKLGDNGAHQAKYPLSFRARDRSARSQ